MGRGIGWGCRVAARFAEADVTAVGSALAPVSCQLCRSSALSGVHFGRVRELAVSAPPPRSAQLVALNLSQEREPSGEPDADERECAPAAASQQRKRRRIGQRVRRQVAERDAERCRHVSPDGKRCEARAFLELHHVEPWALGGEDSVDNLRLLCRTHNRLMAELELGADRVEQAIERRRKRREGQWRRDE